MNCCRSDVLSGHNDRWRLCDILFSTERYLDAAGGVGSSSACSRSISPHGATTTNIYINSAPAAAGSSASAVDGHWKKANYCQIVTADGCRITIPKGISQNVSHCLHAICDLPSGAFVHQISDSLQLSSTSKWSEAVPLFHCIKKTCVVLAHFNRYKYYFQRRISTIQCEDVWFLKYCVSRWTVEENLEMKQIFFGFRIYQEVDNFFAPKTKQIKWLWTLRYGFATRRQIILKKCLRMSIPQKFQHAMTNCL